VCFGIFNVHKEIIREFLSELSPCVESPELSSTLESCLGDVFEAI
jgi:hypothetical protein